MKPSESGFKIERRSGGVNEPVSLLSGERYEACFDEMGNYNFVGKTNESA